MEMRIGLIFLSTEPDPVPILSSSFFSLINSDYKMWANINSLSIEGSIKKSIIPSIEQ